MKTKKEHLEQQTAKGKKTGPSPKAVWHGSMNDWKIKPRRAGEGIARKGRQQA